MLSLVFVFVFSFSLVMAQGLENENTDTPTLETTPTETNEGDNIVDPPIESEIDTLSEETESTLFINNVCEDEDKVRVCHYPEGNLSNPQLLKNQNWYGPSGHNSHEHDFIVSEDFADDYRCPPINPDPVYACSDGIDNDQDGVIDYPNDLGCESATDDDEYNDPEVKQATLHAQKIICDDESDLPNWGAGDVDEITSTTANDWLIANPENGCHLADWDFEWGYSNSTGDPEDNQPGTAGAGWTAFTGATAVVDISNYNQLRVREIYNEDYIPFTGQNTDQDVSPEMYCGSDALNYDNWEWIDASPDTDYYCVAWNVPKEKSESCRVEVVSEVGDEGIGNDDAVAAWVHPTWTTGLNSVATWIWDSFNVQNLVTDESKTFTKNFYVDGSVDDATLNLAADNRYWVTINGDPVISNTGEFNYGAVTGPTDIKSYVDPGWNTIEFKIENMANGDLNPESNPVAGIYQLVVNNSAKTQCTQPPQEEEKSDVTVCKYNQQEQPLSGWEVWLDDEETQETHEYIATTTENGCVIFDDVPYGNYNLGETMKTGWQYVSGTGLVVVDDPNENFSIMNRTVDQPVMFTLSYVAGSHGTISGSSTQVVLQSQNGTAVTANANSGYHFVNWSDTLTDNPRTDLNITGNITVTANFAENQTAQGSSSGGRSKRKSGGEVLGAFTGTENRCTIYLTSHMRQGFENNPIEVLKLQAFLIGQGYEVSITGVFDDLTDKAVREFQKKYEKEILVPWKQFGFSGDSTGYVYKTTRHFINNLLCPGSEPYPNLP